MDEMELKMSLGKNFFQSVFKRMSTPAFVIHKDTGEIIEHNNTFNDLFIHSSHDTPNNWLQLSPTTKSLEQWQVLNKKVPVDKNLRVQENLALGKNDVQTDLELQRVDDQYLLVCLYSNEHIDIAIAENNLFKFALSESASGLWVWDVITDYVECSQSLCDLLGCSPEDSPKSTDSWHELVHPDDSKELRSIVTQHIEEGSKSYEASYRIIKANDESCWVKERGCAYAWNSNSKIIKSVGFIEDISVQKELENHLRKQATFDELTGLLTHAAAMTHFNKQLELAKRQYTQLTMMKINLGSDGNLNLETLSQHDKDIAVKKISESLYNTIRNSDILARVASGQLLLLLPNTNMSNAQNLLIRLAEKIEKLEVELEQGSKHNLSICAGVSTFPEDGETIEELSESANLALEACLIQKANVVEL